MGIDISAFDAILLSQTISLFTKKENMLTLGRQGIHIYNYLMDKIASKYNIKLSNDVYSPYCENLFKYFGFTNIDSIDYSAYENANIIHDMNLPISNNDLLNKYQYIYDGGTIEHIFNTPQVCENIINLLDIGGIFLSVTCNNNLSGHGMYQFSPEFFMSAFSEKYGMKIISIYLAKVNSEVDNWIRCDTRNSWRNMSKFNDNEEVYIITIAQKISNDRLSLITNSPQQYSYEKVDWNK
jgi:hypothetical protein